MSEPSKKYSYYYSTVTGNYYEYDCYANCENEDHTNYSRWNDKKPLPVNEYPFKVISKSKET